MPLRGHTGNEIHSHGLIASEKAAYKSRHGYLVSNGWFLWIAHECNFHVKAEMDFSICDNKVGFPKNSHI